jgi:nicotinate-nucleotide adenylyltransferase
MSVAVFGGSFNPPHVAHALAVVLVLATEEADRVLVVPAYQHPFGKPLAPFEDRVAMCELAMGWIPGVEISRVEERLGGESRTLRTLEHLASEHPDWHMRLVLGADILAEAPRWFGFHAIAKLAPPIVLARAGVPPPEDGVSPASPETCRNMGPDRARLPQVSSTDVRAKIAQGAWDELSSMVPRRVLAYVRTKGLYGAPG